MSHFDNADGHSPNTDKSVVIVGGGIVGASLLYSLSKRGWTDCLLIERNELTSGSTWHAGYRCLVHYQSIRAYGLLQDSM